MDVPLDSEGLLKDVETLFRADEEACLENLFPLATLEETARSRATAHATRWIHTIRRSHKPIQGATELLSHFGLSSEEGIALMCLAEALLRIPDNETADQLIREKLSDAHWGGTAEQHLPLSANVAAWTLALTGKVVGLADSEKHNIKALLSKLVTKLGQPVIRESIKTTIEWMAQRFVAGESIDEVLAKHKHSITAKTPFSFDLMGETARTAAVAERYFNEYMQGINSLSKINRHAGTPVSELSVRLSALQSRYEFAKHDRAKKELMPRLIALCEQAANSNVPVTIDAERSDRLFLTLEIISELMEKPQLEDWNGLGITIQAYEKRAPAVIDYMVALARAHKRKMTIRLVKGAYWEAEIKQAQNCGCSDFPVYTRKQATDISYLACAHKMINEAEFIKPVFATHNAMTIAHILELAQDPSKLEFQRLYGLSEDLFPIMQKEGLVCRTLAPAGDSEIILSHLARRMLDHSITGSFMNLLHNPTVTVENLTADPIEEIKEFPQIRHPFIRRPPDLFLPERKNSSGLDLSNPFVVHPLMEDIGDLNHESYSAVPVIGGKKFGPADHVQQIKNPATGAVIGEVLTATADHIEQAISTAAKGFEEWSRQSVENRAVYIEKLADLFEENRPELIRLLMSEAGKILPDALAEVREAIDFCRYYALRAREDFAPHMFSGPTSNSNRAQLSGRGVFACISPWNFPLSIFTGQIAAALVAGNSVIAKPAPQTPLIAAFVAKLLLDTEIPEDVFSLLPGDADVGISIVQHPAISGVAFTGSAATARSINRALASREGPIVPLIAETGGINVLIADSSALPEQVVDDAISSAFRSAGQNCSALRLLCLPEVTADKIIATLKSAMMELDVGDPSRISTDVGPVIDEEAQNKLLSHIMMLEKDAKLVARLEPGESCANGIFVAPQVWEIPKASWLENEVFGPILHVVRYETDQLDELIDEINSIGCILSGGVNSRIESVTEHVESRLKVCTFYANRPITDASSDIRPFGGISNSGTGPRTGGQSYLARFAMERIISVNGLSPHGHSEHSAAINID